MDDIKEDTKKEIMLMANAHNIGHGEADKHCKKCGSEKNKAGRFLGFNPDNGSPMHTANCSKGSCANHTDCGSGQHDEYCVDEKGFLGFLISGYPRYKCKFCDLDYRFSE